MGISTEQWRTRIGSFRQPGKQKSKTVSTTLNVCTFKHVSLCIRVCLLPLLVAQGVETNPGPPKGRGARASRADTDSLEYSQPGPDTLSNRRTEHSESQSSLMSWMHTQRDMIDDGVDADYPSNNESDSEPDVIYTATILLEIKDVKSLNSKFDGIIKSVNQLKVENRKLKEQNVKLDNKVSTLAEKLQSVETTPPNNVKKQEKLETFSRKNNLKFYDIENSMNETPKSRNE